MIDLLDKLDKIEVKSTDKISSEDKIFIQKLKENYSVITNHLMGIRASLKEQEKLNSNFEKLYEVSEYDSISLKRVYDDDDENEKVWGARYVYTFKYPLKHVKNLIEQAKNRVVIEIVDYFNKTYTLTIKSDRYFEIGIKNKKKKDVNETTDIDHVVDWVLTQTGGLTLKEMGIKLLKDNFKDEINGRTTGWGDNKKDLSAILKGNSLTIPDFVRYYHSDRRYDSLIAALIHFDNGSTELNHSMVSSRIPGNRYNYNSDFDFTGPYETILDKVESLRFYGNGKVIIKFRSALLASEFVSYYSIQLAASK